MIGIGSTPCTTNPVDANFESLVGGASDPSPSPTRSLNGSSVEDVDPSTTANKSKDILNWTPWKTGMAFSYRGRTLMSMKQESNEPCEDFLETWQMKLCLLKSKHRIEVHIYTSEWVSLTNELLELNSHSFSLDMFDCIPGLATKLLIMVTAHVKALAMNWFPGMLTSASHSQPFVTYMPCWKCYAEIGTPKGLNAGRYYAASSSQNRVPIIGVLYHGRENQSNFT